MNEPPASHPASRAAFFGLLVILGIWSMANMVEQSLVAPHPSAGLVAENDR